jgi:hypothetical protein
MNLKTLLFWDFMMCIGQFDYPGVSGEDIGFVNPLKPELNPSV